MESEKAAESRSQLNDAGNTAADALVEVPNDAPLSPGLTLSSTGAANSLANGSRNGLQQGAFLSDDQHTIQTLSDDATWSLETDPDGTHNVPPAPTPTDISNVPDSNAFSWPLFMTDPDWQFDFDIPFTAQHTSASTGPSPSPLTELDTSQFYNRPTQGFDSAGYSRELVEYLSFSEKVSTGAAILFDYGGFYTY